MRYAAALVCLLLAGCATTDTPRFIPSETQVQGFDFSAYTEEGFLITPQSYQGGYQSIGVLNVRVFPRAQEATNSQIESRDDLRPGDYVIGSISPSRAIDSLYQVANKMGADAVINFDVQTVTKQVGRIQVPGYEASGFAIDRAE